MKRTALIILGALLTTPLHAAELSDADKMFACDYSNTMIDNCTNRLCREQLGASAGFDALDTCTKQMEKTLGYQKLSMDEGRHLRDKSRELNGATGTSGEATRGMDEEIDGSPCAGLQAFVAHYANVCAQILQKYPIGH